MRFLAARSGFIARVECISRANETVHARTGSAGSATSLEVALHISRGVRVERHGVRAPEALRQVQEIAAQDEGPHRGDSKEHCRANRVPAPGRRQQCVHSQGGVLERAIVALPADLAVARAVGALAVARAAAGACL